ncbi:MAG: GrpB family protein [Candidatus Limnocylindria bacterium]
MPEPTTTTEWFGAAGDEAVELVDPDPSWPSRFEAIRTRLARALGASALRIDHIGSTAVPAIPAKPVIDVQVSVPSLDAEGAYVPQIESLGWLLRAREPEHRFFRPPAGEPRTVHIHVCQGGSAWERAHLLFRDYLRAHPRSAASYARLKERLAAEVGHDRPAYTRSKDPFIAATLKRAEAWARGMGWQP